MDKKIKKYTVQQCKKLLDKKCYFCGESNYNLLDAHRIVPGSAYKFDGVVTACANCHRRIHSNSIQILGRHPVFGGEKLWILHCIIDGEEKWL